MAKKVASAKKPKKAAQKAAAVKPSETIPVPTEGQFKALLRAVKSHEADKNEAVGSLGSAISAAVEKHNLDKKAFSIFRSLNRLSDRKLATTMAHLDHYRVIGGLDERAERQADMIGREQELAEADVGTARERTNGGRRRTANNEDGDEGHGAASANEEQSERELVH